MEDLGTALLLHVALVDELRQELDAILKDRVALQLSQPERRMFIRATFASTEASIYVLKQTALIQRHNPMCPTISEAERTFAQEQEYKLTDTGEVEIRQAKISLEANMRFAFKLLGKALSIPSALDVSGSGWQSFKRAIKIRDRITHPKSVSDLTVSDEEVNDLAIAFGWLQASYTKAANEINAASSRLHIPNHQPK